MKIATHLVDTKKNNYYSKQNSAQIKPEPLSHS